MSYLMGEMLIYLLGVALLGVLIGWLFTRASWKRKVEDVEVNLFGQLYDVRKQLDTTQLKLGESKSLLDNERSHQSSKVVELQDLQSELLLSKSQFEEKNQQVVELNHSLDEVNQQVKIAESQLEKQDQKNQKLIQEFDHIKNRVSVFESDLDEIIQQSGTLKGAFEQARLELTDKDKRLAELETISSEKLQMAALSMSPDSLDGSSSEPELAISRIARLQARVQELFDELNLKDQEIEKLRDSTVVDEGLTSARKLADMSVLQADDLQEIGGIGGVLEDKLNKMGITRFSEIASWDDSDIDRFDQEFDFSGRIKRENWVEQARKLKASKNPNKRGH